MRIKTFTLKELLIIKEKALTSNLNKTKASVFMTVKRVSACQFMMRDFCLGDTAPSGKTEDKKDRTSSGSFSFNR